MPIAIEVMNRLSQIAAELPEAMNQMTEADAQLLYTEAYDTCPVRTGAMRDAHRIEKIADGHWEVSVQKEEGLSGEETYAGYVNGGTVFMAAQPWFTDAIMATAAKMQSSTLEGVL